ncbi:MAG: hypothetical protein LBI79_05575 [Nitrososphaerota archaeon]|nr:hypothetical protein [Nitrososphaerota archaeon]
MGFYGGADVKALIFVGLTTPALPFVFNPAPGVLELPLVLVVFCNATLLTMIWPLSIFILNLKDGLKKRSMFEGIALSLPEKVWLLFTARRVKLAEIEGLRYFPIERVVLQEGQPTRTLVHFVKAEADLSKYRDNLEENKALYKRGVLASPTIPSICFFTLALATAPLGNLFFWAITLLGAI